MSRHVLGLEAEDTVGSLRSRVGVCLGPMADLTESGLRSMLGPHVDRVVVRRCGGPVSASDLLLFDPTYLPAAVARRGIAMGVQPQPPRRWVCYGDVGDRRLAELAFRAFPGRVRGWLSIRRTGPDLVWALERIDADELVIDVPPGDAAGQADSGVQLTQREAQVLILIASGFSNVQIVERLSLSMNTVKSYIRGAYRKIGVDSRRQAVLWGAGHGFSRWADVLPVAGPTAHEWLPRRGNRSIA